MSFGMGPDEYGWKLLHADVFRPPPHLSWFCALLGTGVQLLLMLVIGLLAVNYEISSRFQVTQQGEGSEFITWLMIVYCLAAPLSGYISGKFYAEMGGKRWIRAYLLTSLLLPLSLVALFLGLNFMAVVYGSTRALSLWSILSMVAIWFFVIMPLTLFGTLIGRNLKMFRYGNPCRVSPVPRPIPPVRGNPIMASPVLTILASGLVPWAALFLEFRIVLVSLWEVNPTTDPNASNSAYIWPILLSLLLITALFALLTGIIVTYLVLGLENHRWHWISFLSSGSISIYLLGEAVVYYIFWSGMSVTLFQVSIYFSYSLALALFCMCLLGSIGYFGSAFFVRKIYATVKID